MEDVRIKMFREIMSSYITYRAAVLFEDKRLSVTVTKSKVVEGMSHGLLPTEEMYGTDVVILYDFLTAFSVVARLKDSLFTAVEEYGYKIVKIDKSGCYLSKII